MKIRHLLLVSLTLIVGIGPEVVYAKSFVCGIWPGEGRPIFVAKSNLPVYASLSRKSPTLKGVTIKKGTKINYIETRIRTLVPGRIKVIVSTNITGRSFGEIDFLSRSDYYSKSVQKTVPVSAGDTIEYLQYRAEGYHIYRINKDVLEAKELDDNFKTETQFRDEWWLGIELENKVAGLLLISEENVDISKSFN